MGLDERAPGSTAATIAYGLTGVLSLIPALQEISLDVVLQIKRAFDWQIILAGKETIVDFLPHCGNTVPHIIRN